MSTQTAGHCEQGGLRGHSRGAGYPETVIGVGGGYAAFNTLTGDLGPVRATYDEARFYRSRARPCPRDCPANKSARLCHTCGWWSTARIDEKRLGLLTGRA